MTAPPAIVNDKPLRLSWSRIRSHQECPQKGHLTSLGKRSPTADIRSYFHGSVVDKAYRDWLAMDDPPPGWMLAHVERILEEEEASARKSGDGIVKWKSPTDKAETREFCKEAVSKLEVVSRELVLPYEWQPATRFSVPIEVPGLDGNLVTVTLNGEMDLLVRHPDGRVEVWDLKATRDSNYWRKVVGQLMFYDICWWGMNNGVAPARTGLIQPMADPQVLPFEFTDDQRREMFTTICNVSMDIMRGAVAPKPDGGACYNCPVKHACPVYSNSSGRGFVKMSEVMMA
jgi:CRISPR/Cas system-associated exonuclease Cas4 (RecB family)